MALKYRTQKLINRLTLGLSAMGAGFSFGDIIYNFKQSFYSFRKFFKVVWDFRGFDYQSTLDILSVCLKMQLEKFQDASFYQEIDETRIPKERKIERCLELLANIKAQGYAERCGYDHNYEVYFKPIPGSKNSTLENTATPEQQAYNKKVRENAKELEEKEWNELMDILRTDLRNFWV
ncbi:MAG: hypothetical protein R6W78_14525 [Bacteroidales bacterium]